MDEDWEIVSSLLPDGWRDLARTTGAMRRRRGFADEDALMRAFLLHAGRGLSLRETVALASSSGLVSVSDVALMKRFRGSAGWLQAVCQRLIDEHAGDGPDAGGMQMHFVDATHVREPGPTGSVWRVHYALGYPGLECRHAAVTPRTGSGNVESFEHFPVAEGICLIGDRGYSKYRGILSVVARGGDVLVRCNPFHLALRAPSGVRLDLDRILDNWPAKQLVAEIDCRIERTRNHEPGPAVHGRLILVKRSHHSAQQAIKRAQRKAAINQTALQDKTLRYAQWFMLFTTLPADRFNHRTCCAWYRLRWQIELTFKRFKSLAQLGHLPKRDAASVQAWIYAKLLVALLTEKLVRISQSISPWGYQFSPSS